MWIWGRSWNLQADGKLHADVIYWTLHTILQSGVNTFSLYRKDTSVHLTYLTSIDISKNGSDWTFTFIFWRGEMIPVSIQAGVWSEAKATHGPPAPSSGSSQSHSTSEGSVQWTEDDPTWPSAFTKKTSSAMFSLSLGFISTVVRVSVFRLVQWDLCVRM